MVLTYGIPLDSATASIYIYHHTLSSQSRVYRVTQLRTDAVHCRESAGTRLVFNSPQGSSSKGCCLCRSTWTNCTPLFSHTHYWYEVGIPLYERTDRHRAFQYHHIINQELLITSVLLYIIIILSLYYHCFHLNLILISTSI